MVQTHARHESAAAWLAKNIVPGDVLLVKGSRAAAMEKLVALLRVHWQTHST
jgi:UDP-N-acetylmuramyl pentapeptide synthase